MNENFEDLLACSLRKRTQAPLPPGLEQRVQNYVFKRRSRKFLWPSLRWAVPLAAGLLFAFGFVLLHHRSADTRLAQSGQTYPLQKKENPSVFVSPVPSIKPLPKPQPQLQTVQLARTHEQNPVSPRLDTFPSTVEEERNVFGGGIEPKEISPSTAKAVEELTQQNSQPVAIAAISLKPIEITLHHEENQDQ